MRASVFAPNHQRQRALASTVLVAVCFSLVACASSQGDVQDLVRLPSNVAQPTIPYVADPPYLADRPGHFPEVPLLLDQAMGTTGSAPVAYASLTPRDSSPAPRERPTTPSTPTAPQDPPPEDPEEPEDPPPSTDITVTDDEPAPPPNRTTDIPDDVAQKLPVPPGSASKEQLDFHNRARNEYIKVFAQDNDSTDALEKLLALIKSDEDLRPLRPAWTPALIDAIEHAEVLQRIRGPMRKLRNAFVNSDFDEEFSIYRNVVMSDCRAAFRTLREDTPEAMEVNVRVEPVGRKTLEEFEVVCQEGHNVELLETDFPTPKGPGRLRKMVKKRYQAAFPNAQVLKVSISQKWKKSSPDARVLRAIVGVKREDAFPFDPCVKEEVVLEQFRAQKKKWGDISCCQVQTSTAVACEVLE